MWRVRAKSGTSLERAMRKRRSIILFVGDGVSISDGVLLFFFFFFSGYTYIYVCVYVCMWRYYHGIILY